MTAQTRPAVVAIDVGGTKIAAALADTAGAVLERLEVPSDAQDGASGVVTRALDLTRRLRRQADARGHAVVGGAVVAPGVQHEDHSSFAPNLPGWDGVALGPQIAEALDLASVPVWNDVHAATLAELRTGGLQGADPGVYIGMGTGLAAGICIGGEVVRGAHGAAGEIGYLRTDPGPGPGARAGIATLEDLVGGKAIGQRASALLGTEIDAAGLFGRTDAAAVQILHHGLGALASAVAHLAVALDPSHIVFGGGMMRSGEVILDVVRAQVARQVPVPPAVDVAHHLHDASLHGAIALALEHPRMPRPADAPEAGRPLPPMSPSTETQEQ